MERAPRLNAHDLSIHGGRQELIGPQEVDLPSVMRGQREYATSSPVRTLMAGIRATKDPGIAIDFTHEELREINEADNAVAVVREKVVAAALVVPVAGPVISDAAETISEVISRRRTELQQTDEGRGVEVVFDAPAIAVGRWEIAAVRPLPSTVPSVSIVETFSW